MGLTPLPVVCLVLSRATLLVGTMCFSVSGIALLLAMMMRVRLVGRLPGILLACWRATLAHLTPMVIVRTVLFPTRANTFARGAMLRLHDPDAAAFGCLRLTPIDCATHLR